MSFQLRNILSQKVTYYFLHHRNIAIIRYYNTSYMETIVFLRIMITIRRKGGNQNTFPVSIHDLFLFLVILFPKYPPQRDNQIFVKEISFLLEEFWIMPNSYLHTMRIFLSYGCVLLLHFTLFVCPMFFRTLSWLNQYIYFYISFLFFFVIHKCQSFSSCEKLFQSTRAYIS